MLRRAVFLTWSIVLCRCCCGRLLIDQLNGQVDFLNSELALREAQLVELGNKLHESDGLQADNSQKFVCLSVLQRCVDYSPDRA